MILIAHTITSSMENVKASGRKISLNYIINGKLKIKYDMHSGDVSAVPTHDENVLEIFGSEMINRVKNKHNSWQWVPIIVAITIFKFIFVFILWTTKAIILLSFG